MSDVLFYGVLRMPYDMAMGDEISRLQFYQRVQQAAGRLEAAELEVATLRAELAQRVAGVPDGWVLAPAAPTAEIVAAAAMAAWPTASPADIELARKAAPLVLMGMDMAPGMTVDALAGVLATMAPAYRAMLAAAPVPPNITEKVGCDSGELHFNATRLRNVARLVGLESAVPQDDATLDGARGSVLGMIAGKLRAAQPTDLSVRLRETADQQPGWKPLLTQAADEIERYYGGMLNWKAAAQQKDKLIIGLRHDAARLDYIANLAMFNQSGPHSYINVGFNLDSADGNLRAAIDAASAVQQEGGAA